jgi:hypothetical protein
VSKHTFKSIPSGTASNGQNVYVIGTLPAANSFANPQFTNVDNDSCTDPTTGNPVSCFPNGISDWGPFPSTMTARNAFRGPGAWNVDAALSKTFPIHELVNLEFRAEGFDVFNHHNLYLLAADNNVANFGDAAPTIQAQKGGVNGGVNDERRFGQFALKVNF